MSRRLRRYGSGVLSIKPFGPPRHKRLKCELATVCAGGADATHLGVYGGGRTVICCDQCLMPERTIFVDWRPLL